MKQVHIIFLILLFTGQKALAQNDSLNIYYYQNYPYAYSSGPDLVTQKSWVQGIEVEILEEYVRWLKLHKGISLKLQYTAFNDFGEFYTSVKTGRSSVVGLGSVTWQAEREEEVSFSPTHLMNQAVLITDGKWGSIREENKEELNKVLAGQQAVTLSRSSHERYLNDIKSKYLPELAMVYTEKASAVLDSISTGRNYFGYSDIVTYWSYVKNNPKKFLKIQKALSTQKEELAFVMPKQNMHGLYLNEFFESGFGFTATKTYHQILERYLGHEIIDYVELK